ncbi:MAG: trypsin-like serine peptidase, partial [Planctomycetota bacterium]
MNWKMATLTLLIAMASVTAGLAQQPICVDGSCDNSQASRIVRSPFRQDTRPVGNIVLDPLRDQILVEDHQLDEPREAQAGDRFEQVIRATVRVTVSGVCGSGTVVGRDAAGNAIVLTNAHVAGTTRGRVVNVERWNPDGSSERGTGTIIASGYGRGTSVDFALLKCSAEFARGVAPIPLADRYPSVQSGVTTYGCPRCEWPSLQVLRLNRKEGQILSWKPEAIGGRSGSSLIDYTDDGPRVVGLLTWAGGGEGLGQSTPFLLSAMRGKLPATLEGLPAGVREVSCQESDVSDVFQVPSTTSGD